ncbi:glycosyltransferase family 2 protein [Blautia sp. HCP3S3_C4]|uniref:glycosyltransferase family 2 protein n=1 Tax=Blautia sp. HCP3S3_C4 TaxID=3438911 RepID=UPI003F8C7D87
MFTIVTITFNADQVLSKTIESVYSQTNTDYEYFIIDGKSSDNTVTIAKKYESSFQKKGVLYYILSEKDSGIYNAMNKAIKLAHNKWIMFMNAGDCFLDDKTLENVKKRINKDAIVVYGDVVLCKNNMYKYSKAKPLVELRTGMVFCHQSSFVCTAWAKNHVFDEKYKYAADYEMMLSAYLANCNFQYIDFPFAIYECGGVSTKNAYAFKREFLEIQRNLGLMSMQDYLDKEELINKYERKSKILELITSCIPLRFRMRYVIRKQKKTGWKANTCL